MVQVIMKCTSGGRGVLQEKLYGGVQPAAMFPSLFQTYIMTSSLAHTNVKLFVKAFVNLLAFEHFSMTFVHYKCY